MNAAREMRLRACEHIAAGTMAFRFERPAGFDFRAGQAIDLILVGARNLDEGARRHAFSLASAPFEDELMIATRMRDSAYKRALGSLPIGGKVALEGPFGSLTLHKDAGRGAVLIAGGIGITPFLSMLRQARHDRADRPIALLYSNRRPEDAAFLAELHELAGGHPHFRLVATMTDAANSSQGWDGETRVIGADLLALAADRMPAPIYYVVGPPAMVESMRGALRRAGVDEDDVRTEEFYGY